MSQVTCCDFCMATSRTAAETVRLELPRDLVPEPLHILAANATAATIKLDVCGTCRGEFVEVLEEFIARRVRRDHRGGHCLMLPILDASQESALTAVAAQYLAVTQWVLGEGGDGYPQAERAEIIRRREVCTLITGGAQ